MRQDLKLMCVEEEADDRDYWRYRLDYEIHGEPGVVETAMELPQISALEVTRVGMLLNDDDDG